MNYELIIPILIIPILLLLLWRLRIKKIASYYSPQLGKVEVLQKYNGEKLLTINTYAQGVSINDPSIQKSYWYQAAKQTISHCQKTKHPQVLILGLGANTISNLMHQLNPKVHQTIVEFDPIIIQVCKDHFNLEALSNYKIIKGNAYEILKSKFLNPNSYDTIIVDIFTGNPPYVDLKSNRPNFIRKLLPLLRKDGLIIFNRPGNTEEARCDSFQLQLYLETLFENSQFFDVKDPRGYRNNVITAWGRKKH